MKRFHPSLSVLALISAIGLSLPAIPQHALAQTTPFGTPVGAQKPARVAPSPGSSSTSGSTAPEEDDPAEGDSEPRIQESPLRREFEALRSEVALKVRETMRSLNQADSTKVGAFEQRAAKAEDYVLATFFADAQKALLSGEEPAPKPDGVVPSVGVSASLLAEYKRVLAARPAAKAAVIKRVQATLRARYVALQKKAAQAGDYALAAQIKEILDGKAVTEADPGDEFLGIHTNKDNPQDKIQIWKEGGKIRLTWFINPERRVHEAVSVSKNRITFSNGRILTKSGTIIRESGRGSEMRRSYIVSEGSLPSAAVQRGASWMNKFSGVWRHSVNGGRFEIRVADGVAVFMSLEGWWKSQYPAPIRMQIHSSAEKSLRLPTPRGHDGDYRVLTLKDADTLIERNFRAENKWKRVRTRTSDL
ncbi:MAG: hypothetical protein LBG65_02100 [Puniceicoccales bacterium]|jgi:hypothetical protein|nr:hypothetical protein [Puniceicoccales bacterium]